MAKKNDRVRPASQASTGGKDAHSQERMKGTWNQWRSMRAMLAMNAVGTMSRDALLRKFKCRDIDMDHECRWPTTISAQDYKDMFERNGLAGRVVNVWPSECWIMPPEIYEIEDAETETEAEKAWKALDKDLGLLSELRILDILSGIGRFGILVLGLTDLGPNEGFDKPVEGVDLATGDVSSPLALQLLYTRVYQEADVEIVEWDQDRSHKRYGQPVMYQVKMEDPGGSGQTRTEKVHWTRVLHQADNRLSSIVFGEPRMKPVYNDILDAMKVKGSASEGYWRAGLSGIVWGLDPQLMDPNTTINDETKDEMRDEFEEMWNSMQRFMFSEGLVPHDIAPHLVDPSPYIKSLIELICIRIEVPVPIFTGREQGELAADENQKSWIDRVIGRQNNYLTPCLLRPFLRRLQMYGCLPWTEEELSVDWPDRNSPGEKEIAETAVKITEALSKYVQGGVNQVMGEEEYFGQVLKKTPEEIEVISEGVNEWEDLNNPPEPEPSPDDNIGRRPNEGNTDVPA